MQFDFNARTTPTFQFLDTSTAPPTQNNSLIGASALSTSISTLGGDVTVGGVADTSGANLLNVSSTAITAAAAAVAQSASRGSGSSTTTSSAPSATTTTTSAANAAATPFAANAAAAPVAAAAAAAAAAAPPPPPAPVSAPDRFGIAEIPDEQNFIAYYLALSDIAWHML